MKLLSPHQRLVRAIERDIPKNTGAREQFDHLCASGCKDVTLYGHLLMVVNAAYAPKLSVYDLMSGPRRDKSGQFTECTEKVSRAKLAKLPKDVERIAEQIGEAQSIIARLYETKSPALNDQFLRQKQQRWSSPDGLYAILPDLLRMVATDMGKEFDWIDERFGVRRYDSLRGQMLGLLKYVDRQTGAPHYERVLDILSPLLEKNTDNRTAPDFLSDVDALTHFYSRAKKYGFRPRTKPQVSAD